MASITATEVKASAGRRATPELYRGAEYVVDFLPKIKLEVAVTDDRSTWSPEAIIARPAPARSATARSSCGALDQVVRIRTGEMDADAL